MKCEEIQLMIASAPAGAPPETARTHLADCAECRTFAGQDAAVRWLLGLKRYEKPDPFFETRLLAGVREQIAGTAPSRNWLGERFGAALFRYAAAAAIVAAVGWQALRFAARPGAAPVPVVAVKPALPPTPPPTPPNALPAFRSMEYVSAPSAGATNLLLPAGFHPGALQYGPGNGTVPVKFDY